MWDSLTASEVLTTLGSVLGNIVKWLSQAATAVANFVSGLDPGTIQSVATAIISIGTALIGIKAGVKIAQALKNSL